jgi:hypothetical protein
VVVVDFGKSIVEREAVECPPPYLRIDFVHSGRDNHPPTLELGPKQVVLLLDGGEVHGPPGQRCKEKPGKPTRCHGSVSTWPVAGGGESNELKIG